MRPSRRRLWSGGSCPWGGNSSDGRGKSPWHRRIYAIGAALSTLQKQPYATRQRLGPPPAAPGDAISGGRRPCVGPAEERGPSSSETRLRSRRGSPRSCRRRECLRARWDSRPPRSISWSRRWRVDPAYRPPRGGQGHRRRSRPRARRPEPRRAPLRSRRREPGARRKASRLPAGGLSWRASPGGATRIPAREELLERHGAHASAAAQLGIGHDRSRADAGSEAAPHGALGVEAAQGSTHQRPPTVVAEALLVPDSRYAVAPQMGIGELPESRAADEADNLILLHRAARVAAENRDPVTLMGRRRGGRIECRGHGSRLRAVHHRTTWQRTTRQRTTGTASTNGLPSTTERLRVMIME